MTSIRCALLGHRWRFVRISLEGHKVWECQRCGVIVEGRKVR